MFNREDDDSDESDVSIDEDPEFGQPKTPEEEEPEPVDDWKPKPYPDQRRGLSVSNETLKCLPHTII